MTGHYTRTGKPRRLILVLCVSLLSATRSFAWRQQAENAARSSRGLEDSNETAAPTAMLSNTTASPTTPSNLTTAAPTAAPSNATVQTLNPTTPLNTAKPTAAGTTPPTAAPVVPVSHAPTISPTSAPSGGTLSPTTPHKGIYFWRFVEKTIAYLILLVLALLGFGALMANRYRIYFFLRGVWYTILQMECTLWCMRKLRIADYFGYSHPMDSTLSTSLFENELNEGLLMRETDT
jgi:hypothetical protein